MATRIIAYTNKELADEYYRSFRHDFCFKYTNRKFIIRNILEAAVDIPQFYRNQGSLQGLKVSGIGPKTISVLEKILEKEVAKRGKGGKS
ncbi:MAG: hypothetical protein V1743_07260 [Nanoarchaeota archaeon]